MSLFITSLNSGSNGNCYYIGTDKEAILVDAGISCREIERRMKRLDLSMQKVHAVLVSHEHTDHIRGIPTLAKKYQLPIYITEPTHHYGRLYLDGQLLKPFSAYHPIVIGDMTITPFPKMHDASDPYSFIVTCKEVRVGIFTDIGWPCEHVVRHFSQCHAAFLETNYDEDMLQNGRYPYYLKKRISGEKGHLSNKQALELFKAHRPSFMSHLFLSHLSKENNSPELVENLFNQHANGIKIIVASRYRETEVYRIEAINGGATNATNVPVRISAPVRAQQLQLAFA
ncbi:MAG TPA: MBL fold metallo-hydrolase [Chitinophagaceae bacterium]|nr:MBL fold metallo-hydrolase [Chitinophagaceae bacterium]